MARFSPVTVGSRLQASDLISTGNKDIASLVERSQAGDREAFGLIYARFHQFILCGFLSAGVAYEQSWDLMQETFLHALRGIHTLETSADLRLGGWLRRIAVNVLRQQRRAADTACLSGGELFPAIPDGSGMAAGHQSATMENYGALQECIRDLEIGQRRVVLYRFFFGYSGRRIAATFGAAEATIRSRLGEALSSLRECLASKGITIAAIREG